jgi:hypothetical protein
VFICSLPIHDSANTKSQEQSYYENSCLGDTIMILLIDLCIKTGINSKLISAIKVLEKMDIIKLYLELLIINGKIKFN